MPDLAASATGSLLPGSTRTLTPRERMVLHQLGSGFTTAQIANRLAISPKTVENHKQRIYAKLGAGNQSQAVAIGLHRGLAEVKAPSRSTSNLDIREAGQNGEGTPSRVWLGTGPLRLLIGDADSIRARRLSRACASRDVMVLGVRPSLEALSDATETDRPHVVVLSDPLADRRIDGVLTKLVHAGARVIVVSHNDSLERMLHVLVQGASGYLICAKPQQVADAVISVGTGGAVLPPELAGPVLEQWRRLRSNVDRITVTLSRREKDVLGAMAEGLPTKVIARRLGVAFKTVESHKVRLFDKLGARSQAQAVSIALAHHLLVLT